MAPLVSRVAAVSNTKIDWLSNLDNSDYDIHQIPLQAFDLTIISEENYHILLLNTETPYLEIEHLISEVNRSQPLISIIALCANMTAEYELKLIEWGIDEVLDSTEDSQYLTRRLDLVRKRNQAKRISARHNRNLNAVTILSRRLHNSNNPNSLIIDALDIVTLTFNLMGLAIVLENGSQFHLRASNSSAIQQKRIYDVIVQLHEYSPIRQSMDKGLVMVFEDLSLNNYMTDIPIFDKLNSAIVVPLKYVNITLGAMMAFGTEANPLTRDDIVIYEHLATHLGSAYQNVRHSYTQDVSAKTNLHLLRTWQQLSKVYNPKDMDETVRALATEIPGVKHTLLWLYNESTDQPLVNSSNITAVRVFNQLYKIGIIDDYLNQFDIQLHPLIIWLGRSNTRNIGDLFQAMEGQQLIIVPLHDEARLLGCILVSSNSNEQMSPEYISLLEGIAHASGQTIARNLLITYKDQQAERLEAITRSIKDGIFFVDELQNIVFCNPQFTELTGISPSDVLNNSVQALLDELSYQSDDPQQTRQQLENAISQITIETLDNEYPIVEIHISKISSHIYVEFTVLPTDSDNNPNWIGVIRSSDSMPSTELGISPSILTSLIHHVQSSNSDIYRKLVSIQNDDLSKRQKRIIRQTQNYNQDIEQLFNNIQNLIQIDQTDIVDKSWNDPEKLLSIILNKPPLLQYINRIEFKLSIKNTKISVYRHLLMQSLVNLVESALQLSDEGATVQIQVGLQANRFIFRVISSGPVIPTDQIKRIIQFPEADVEDVPFAVRLRIYFTKIVSDKHNGQLIIKKALSNQGMQFNLLIPVSESEEEIIVESEAIDGIPNRKLSSVMVYDTLAKSNDVDYEYLVSENYDLIVCDQLEQVYNEVDLIRVDILILTNRQSTEQMIQFINRLRQQKRIKIPILMLSTDNAESVRIRSLRAGVDAFVDLPISNAELLVQVENLFQRSKLPERVREPLFIGKLNIDFAQRLVSLDGKNIDLTRIEYDLLCHLALNLGQTLTHTELLAEVWGPEYKNEKQYLWVNISRLRRKLEISKDKTRYIYTQSGVGYILKDPDSN